MLYYTVLKRLARDKHSSVLWKSVKYGCKKFIAQAPGCEDVVVVIID